MVANCSPFTFNLRLNPCYQNAALENPGIALSFPVENGDVDRQRTYQFLQSHTLETGG